MFWEPQGQNVNIEKHFFKEFKDKSWVFLRTWENVNVFFFQGQWGLNLKDKRRIFKGPLGHQSWIFLKYIFKDLVGLKLDFIKLFLRTIRTKGGFLIIIFLMTWIFFKYLKDLNDQSWIFFLKTATTLSAKRGFFSKTLSAKRGFFLKTFRTFWTKRWCFSKFLRTKRGLFSNTVRSKRGLI